LRLTARRIRAGRTTPLHPTTQGTALANVETPVRRPVAPPSIQRILEVPASRWHAVAVQSARDLWANSVVEWSAAIAFYAVLSLFPLLILGMVLASYVTDPAWATREATRLLGEFIPLGQVEIEATVNRAIENRYRVGALSLVIIVVTGRRILGVLTKALNHVSDVDQRDETLFRRVLVELGLAGGLIALGVLALLARPLIELAWRTSQLLPGADGPTVVVIHVLVRAIILVALFGMVYAFAASGAGRRC
jgi:membrane protein